MTEGTSRDEKYSHMLQGIIFTWSSKPRERVNKSSRSWRT